MRRRQSGPQKLMNWFDPNFLFASLFWSSVGMGYFIYGKRQQAIVPLIAGIVMIVVSCFVASIWLMSLLCVGLMALVYALVRRGY